MLERVGVKIGERVQEVVDVATGETDEPTSNGTSDSNHSTPMEERGLLKHPSLVAFASYGGTETPPLARPTSPGDKVDVGADGSLQNPYPSDPVLTPEQLIMIANLNSIPHLKVRLTLNFCSNKISLSSSQKFLTYLPRSRNSHGESLASPSHTFADVYAEQRDDCRSRSGQLSSSSRRNEGRRCVGSEVCRVGSLDCIGHRVSHLQI